MKLLWIDDDYVSRLNPLSIRIERRGFYLIKFGNYEDAMNYIENDPEFEEIKAVLLDVVVPSTGQCLSYAGFEIARAIASKTSVERIAFLSVVLRDEIKNLYDALKINFKDLKLHYTDKTVLLEPSIFDELISFLNPNHKK